jgi:DNA-binding transcriptional regulator YiaG
MTQQALAEKLRTHTNMISHWEAGRRSPNRTMAVKLFKLAGIPIETWDQETRAAV